jgi:hypothetical protein
MASAIVAGRCRATYDRWNVDFLSRAETLEDASGGGF